MMCMKKRFDSNVSLVKNEISIAIKRSDQNKSGY